MRKRTVVQGVILAVVLLAACAVAFVRMGVYNVAADEEHMPLVRSVIASIRVAGVERRARPLVVPELSAAARIASGAREYDEMCAGCHRAPGRGISDLQRGLNPQPPDLTRLEIADPRQAFWVIKHGIRMSGMPAWGKSHGDDTIWDIVAFLHRLPGLSPAQYRRLVGTADGGHTAAGSDMSNPSDQEKEAGAAATHSEEKGSKSRPDGHEHRGR